MSVRRRRRRDPGDRPLFVVDGFYLGQNRVRAVEHVRRRLRAGWPGRLFSRDEFRVGSSGHSRAGRIPDRFTRASRGRVQSASYCFRRQADADSGPTDRRVISGGRPGRRLMTGPSEYKHFDIPAATAPVSRCIASIAMIRAYTPSIRSVDFAFDGWMLPALSVSTDAFCDVPAQDRMPVVSQGFFEDGLFERLRRRRQRRFALADLDAGKPVDFSRAARPGRSRSTGRTRAGGSR